MKKKDAKKCFRMVSASISTSKDVNVAPNIVWRNLIDFKGHSEWNTVFAITTPQGDAAVGRTIHVAFSNDGMQFDPTVLVNDGASEFRWKGKLCCEGCFDGEHYFRVQPANSGRATTLTHGENFSGCLVCCMYPCLECLVLKDTRLKFEAFNSEMKAFSERAGGNQVAMI